jgi:hypothetical protein
VLGTSTKSTNQTTRTSAALHHDRRSSPRSRTATPVLTRTVEAEYREEVRITCNTSRDGFYFQTHSAHYAPGMRIGLILGFSRQGRKKNPTWLGEVVRVDRLEEGGFGVAVHILTR